MIKLTKIDTPLGEMLAGAEKDGICLLEFNDTKILSSESEGPSELFNTAAGYGSNKHLTELRKQLKEYFNGTRKEFTLTMINHGTEFQQSVWKELQTISFGTTRSYLDLANAIKKPGSVRAVANANGANRIAIIIPCHRVIGADGSLTGYGGGLERKKWLIDHERKYSGKPVNGILF